MTIQTEMAASPTMAECQEKATNESHECAGHSVGSATTQADQGLADAQSEPTAIPSPFQSPLAEGGYRPTSGIREQELGRLQAQKARMDARIARDYKAVGVTKRMTYLTGSFRVLLSHHGKTIRSAVYALIRDVAILLQARFLKASHPSINSTKA